MTVGVLFVATPGPLGGSNVSLLGLLLALDGKVRRIVAAPEGAFLEEVRSKGAADSIIVLGRRGTLKRFRLVFWSLLLAIKTLKHRRQLDVIHANATNGMRVGASAGRLLKLPMVVWVHDSSVSRSDLVTARFYRMLVYRPSFHSVSCVADDVISRLGFAAGPVSDHRIPNPLDPGRVVSTRRAHTGPIRIAYLGSARLLKGFDIAVETVTRTRHLTIQWLFFTHRDVAGWNRRYWARLEAEDSDYVHIREPRRDVAEIYAQCDVVFVPSRQESFGLIAAEAMANGLPVVASDIAAFREVVGHNQAGMLFAAGDSAAAAEALECLVYSESLRRKLGHEGLLRSSQYTPQRIAEQIFHAYRTSMGDSGE